VLVVHGILEVAGETADSIWTFASFLAISPWVVRRALRLTYGRGTFQVVRRSERGSSLSYQESLKVMWLLAWRTLLLSLVGLLVFSLALRLIRFHFNVIADSPLANNLGLSAVDALSSLLLTPVLVPGMLRKNYRGFRLELIEEPTPVASRPWDGETKKGALASVIIAGQDLLIKHK
jgi:hypothetical protein